MCKKLEEEEHEATMINSSSFPPEVNVPVERINYAVHHRPKPYQVHLSSLSRAGEFSFLSLSVLFVVHAEEIGHLFNCRLLQVLCALLIIGKNLSI